MNELSTGSLTPLANKTDQACMAVAEMTQCCQEIDMRYLHLGKMLLYVRENELYKHYSEHTQTMSAFLREIDLGIGLSQADHYIRVYKTFGEHMEGRKIAFKRLLLIHPMVKDELSLVYWLNKAEELPLVALVAEKREHEGKTAADNCDHPESERQAFWRCGKCNAWVKEGK